MFGEGPWEETAAKQSGMLSRDVDYHRPTKLERLQAMKAQLDKKLQEVNEAIEALEANPGLADLIHKLEKAGNF